MSRVVFSLIQPDSGRRLRVEVPTVFGRHNCFYDYAKEGKRFTDEAAALYAQQDFVEISGDTKISRTHGLLSPKGPTISDLSSLNGIRFNGECLARNAQRTLAHGDVLTFGQLPFQVEILTPGEKTFHGELWANRQAVVAPGNALGAVQEFLCQRKSFRVSLADDWKGLLRCLGILQALAQPTGITTVALAVELRGPSFALAGEPHPVRALTAALSVIAGTKVLVLHASGDPTAFEEAFEEEAYQDMVLLTGTVPLDSGISNPIEDEICTSQVKQVLDGLSRGGGAMNPLHSVLDGLDALIEADTNVLNVDWFQGYEGALKIVVGKRLHRDYEVETSYRYEMGTETFRRRYHFDSSRMMSSDP